MAKSPRAAAPDMSKVEPDGQYRVELSKSVEVGRSVLRPRDHNVVKGKVLLTIAHAVTRFEPA